MTLRIGEVSNATFWWEWDKDPSVRIEMVPCSPSMGRASMSRAGVKISGDGIAAESMFSMTVEQAKLCFRTIEGVLDADGNPITCSHKNIEKIAADKDGLEVIQSAVTAAVEEYGERRQHREGVEGN